MVPPEQPWLESRGPEAWVQAVVQQGNWANGVYDEWAAVVHEPQQPLITPDPAGGGCFRSKVTFPCTMETLRKRGWALGANLWGSQDVGLQGCTEAVLRQSGQDQQNRGR